MNTIKVALAGNPNSGKTTLLNALTGSKHKVGNWAGVTVEKKESILTFEGRSILLTDLPGTYSLTPYTIEEKITRNYILDEKPDVLINIVDAVNIERNLYLTSQLIEMEQPMVVALNMMDEARKKGFKIDVDRLSSELGVPVVPIVALTSEGINNLMKKVVEFTESNSIINNNKLEYGVDIEKMIQRIQNEMEHHKSITDYPSRWLAIKALEKDDEMNRFIDENLYKDLKLENVYTDTITDYRYRFISGVIQNSISRPHENAYAFSDKIDRVLLHPVFGIPIFAGVMYLMFFLTFNIGNVFLDLIDVFFSDILSGWVLSILTSLQVAEWMKSLVVDGIIGGVGGVLTFVPNIAILFIFISFLEDSGYMARVAFLLDEGMQKVGLNGKTFIPLILGFGCNVPAIMATRTLESENDRLIAILINPFMSCGARFPVYVLIASAFFPGNETLVTFSLYLLGIIIAVLVGYVFRRTLFKGEKTHFIMELPPYRIPAAWHLTLHVWDRVKGYIVKAGTVIFGASVILWFVLNFNMTGMVTITDSFGAMAGKMLAPIFAPLGFGTWQATLSLFTGIIAKEIIIANMALVYGMSGDPSAGEFLNTMAGSFNQLTAYVFLVFVLLYTPCVGVIGIIKRETNSWKWTGFSVLYQFAIAWIVSFVIYRVGLLFTNLL